MAGSSARAARSPEPEDPDVVIELLEKMFSRTRDVFWILSTFQTHKERLFEPQTAERSKRIRARLLANLLTETAKHLKQLEDRDFPYFKRDLSDSLNGIYFSRFTLNRLIVYDEAEPLFKDLEDSDKYKNALQLIRSENRHFEKDSFQSWVSDTEDKIRHNNLEIRESEPVITFKQGNLMEVSFKPIVLDLIEEAQSLSVLGFSLSGDIKRIATAGKKFVKVARELEQIASFHNSIGDKMIPSQRPMMLEIAVALSKTVQEHQGITWNDTDEIERYLKGLRKLVFALGKQNEQLAEYHTTCFNIVSELFYVDLLDNVNRNLELRAQLKSTIRGVADKGYKNTKSWEIHWDYQFYKALDCQYTSILETVINSIEPMRTQLIYNEGNLQFKPTMGELRKKFYHSVLQVLSIPYHIRGVSSDANHVLYSHVCDRNEYSHIFEAGESLLAELYQVKAEFDPWFSFGASDPKNLSTNRLRNSNDYDMNFRHCKTVSQEIWELPLKDRIFGCFVLSSELLKYELDVLNKRCWETVSALLRHDIRTQMRLAEDFLLDAIGKLKYPLAVVEQLPLANKMRHTIALNMSKISKHIESIEEKNETLKYWTKEWIEMAKVQELEVQFQNLYDKYEDSLESQWMNFKKGVVDNVNNVQEDIENFLIRWDQLKPSKMDAVGRRASNVDAQIAFTKERREEWNNICKRMEKAKAACAKIDCGTPIFHSTEGIEDMIQEHEAVWLILQEFRNEMREYENQEWIVFRTKPHKFEEFLTSWDLKLRKQENKSESLIKILKDITNYKALIPNLKFIRGDMFSENHWHEFYSLVKMKPKPLGKLRVKHFLEATPNINAKIKELKELNMRAAGEITVRQALNDLDGWEIEAQFTFTENVDSKNNKVPIIKDFKTALNKVGDNQSLLSSIKTSQYYTHFADRISMWETRLFDLDEFIQSLSKIQRRWIYLEPILSQGVLDNEQGRFKRIDEEFRSIMIKIAKDSRIVSLCRIQGIRGKLNMLQDQLSRCQKSLNEYLEKKRSDFPRFYFIGDEDLLEILGQSTNPTIIQAHLKKLFGGISNVNFDQNNKYITDINSIEGEVVPLKTPVEIKVKVEEWLGELSKEMVTTLKFMLLDCISDQNKTLLERLDKYPSQISQLANAIQFTDTVEKCLKTRSLKAYESKLNEELGALTKLVVEADNSNMDAVLLKLKDLILDIIHEQRVVEDLLWRKVTNVESWEWQKQLRFYFVDGVVVIKMADASFNYSYEYQGISPKIVHTPLTDKCYLTLTQAMKMGLGGNPYGPAGTGKTESVKALGALFGRQVLVFNCDEGIDVKSMGRIFIGLVKCGAWGCFDEFNRLDGATLSAVSMQIQPIQSALKTGTAFVNLLDKSVPVDPNTGIFVTMNPAGKGYGGRNKLPDNLKQLFRPVVMSVPDNLLIAATLLQTEGFKFARKIAKKLVEIFNIAATLFNTQNHYDWGLRSLKSVLKGAGAALKAEVISRENEQSLDEGEETALVVAALRANTLPKLIYTDLVRYDQLVKDVFLKVQYLEMGSELLDVFPIALDKLNFSFSKTQICKCLEFYEQIKQRMGVVIVGPPGCGKSAIRNIVHQSLLEMGKCVKIHLLNPKSMSKNQLLGFIDLDTRQWTDGVLTLLAQQVYSEPPDVTSWILCDGDIDPEWIESLNSVLDDNRLLTLPSGWRIKFGPNVNFIFETHDLSFASPATISRMGMVFMTDFDLSEDAIVHSWLKSLIEPECWDKVETLINDYFYKALNWVRQVGDCQFDLPFVSILQTGLSQLTEARSEGEFGVGLIRGFSPHLKETQREEFLQQVALWTNIQLASAGNLMNAYYDLEYERVYIYENDMNFGEAHKWALTPRGEFPTPLARTATVKRCLTHIRPWFDLYEPFILIGPHGSGKTMILNCAFTAQQPNIQVATIYCSSLVSTQTIMDKLDQTCITISKNTGRTYKSKDSERLILYFKDINLVKADKWGTCQLVEFITQMIKCAGFWDNNLEWVSLEGIQIVSSMTLGSGSQLQLSPRLIGLNRICTIFQPDKSELTTVYRGYFRYLFKTVNPFHPYHESVDVIDKMADTMVEIFTQVQSTFITFNRVHFTCTARDLTKWIHGMMRYEEIKNPQVKTPGVLQVMAHEAVRIFREKIISTKDKEIFDGILQSVIETDWHSQEFLSQVNSMYYMSAKAVSHVAEVKPGSTLVRVTNEIMTQIVEKGIAIFGREVKQLNVVVFPEVLRNVANLDRALSAPCSSLLLVGRSGVGRRTALSIVSALQGASLWTLKVGRGYDMKAFKGDIKTAIQSSAVEGNHIYFILEDFQLIQMEFLDVINSLLSCGEVPGLYSKDEFEGVIAPLRDIAAGETDISLTDFFANRVRQFFHVVFIIESTNDDFIKECENNPAIFKECTMLWSDMWSDDSLKVIPIRLIQKYYNDRPVENGPKSAKGSAPSKRQHNIPTGGFQKIFKTFEKEKFYSPRKFISFVHMYAKLARERRGKSAEKVTALMGGLEKLKEAEGVVEILKAEATSHETVLADKREEANNALELITDTMRNANLQRGEMESLRQKTLEENEILKLKKAAIDEELKEIEPVIEAARSSVGAIKNESISEIRSLRAPPEGIRDILEAVLRLMGIHDMTWNSMKTFLAQRGVKDEIRSFDARKIKKEDRDRVHKLITEREKSFKPENAARASAAAAPLAAWVTANVQFSLILEKIHPLEKQQNLLMRNLNLAESQVGKLSDDLENVDQRVELLKTKLNQYTKEAAQIEVNLEKAKETLKAAEDLVGKLHDEYLRWSEELEKLTLEQNDLSFNSLMSAAFITFLSESPEESRRKYMEGWAKMFKRQSIDICKFLSSEKEILTWQSIGLPTDTISHQNAIIVMNLANGEVGTFLRPFIVDPTNRAIEWLTAFLGTIREVKTISFHDPKLPNELELAVRFGKILVIQEVDQIEPILVPVLRGDFISNGARDLVQIGQKLVDFNPDFQLYMTTRNAKIVIPPDVECMVTNVNFDTTVGGLTSQLLTRTLAHEKPELEERRKKILKSIESLKMQLDEVGESLLRELSSAQGNILENKELLASLNQTKEKSKLIKRSLEDSSELQASLDKEIDIYKPLAKLGSKIYFIAIQAAKLNKIYTISLGSFLHLFDMSLNIPRNSTSQFEHRLEELGLELLEKVYEALARSLFKEDRIPFALHMARMLYAQVKDEEWALLLNEFTSETALENHFILPPHLDDELETPLRILREVIGQQAYSSLSLHRDDLWAKFNKSEECEKMFPDVIKEVVTPIQMLLVVQAMRPDRLFAAMTSFARTGLRGRSIQPRSSDLKSLYEETRSSEPILILIASGSDPSEELSDLANSVVGSDNYFELSMGHGMAELALEKIKSAGKEGHWVCIKNLHLVTTWLSSLEKEIQSMKPHSKFRLWLTTEPHQNFPVLLAQSCLKIAYEAPRGLKNNVQRTFKKWSNLNIFHTRAKWRSQVFFTLAYFHGILQERRTFIPQGWKKSYEFNESDLKAAVELISPFFGAEWRGEIRWDYIRGVLEDAIYGGKIENDLDSKILGVYLREFFNEEFISGANMARIVTLPFKMPFSNLESDYVQTMELLPESETPELFGLPLNIGRSWQQSTGEKVISSLKILSREFADEVIFDLDVWEEHLEPVLTHWKKLHVDLGTANLLHLKRPGFVDYKDHDHSKINPITDFLDIELTFGLNIIKVVHHDLGIISKVLRGSYIPNDKELRMGDTLIKREIPTEWAKFWEGSSDPIKYMTSILVKTSAVVTWRTNMKNHLLFEKPLDLALIFSPGGFLNAFKQNCARKQSCPMDELVLVTDWMDIPGEIGTQSFKLANLLLQGASYRMDTSMIQESNNSSPILLKLPPVMISWIPKKDYQTVMNLHTILVPLYQDESREKLITFLHMTSDRESYYVLSGIALFLSNV